MLQIFMLQLFQIDSLHFVVKQFITIKMVNVENEAFASAMITKSIVSGNTQDISYWLKQTRFPNSPDEFGWTPIHYAAMKGQHEVVKEVAKYVADVNPPDNNGDTPLHVAAFYGHLEVVKVLKTLLGKNVHIRNEFGKTPKDVANESENFVVMQALSRNKKNPFARYRKWFQTVIRRKHPFIDDDNSKRFTQALTKSYYQFE